MRRALSVPSALAVAGLVVAACSTPTTTPTPTPPPAVTSTVATVVGDAYPIVEITRTGGLAGVDQDILVDALGGWHYSDVGAATTTAGTLTDAELSRLNAVLANTALTTELAEAAEAKTLCVDALSYLIQVAGQGGYTYGDCVQEPTVAELIAAVADPTPF